MKTFSTSGTGSQQTLSEIESEVIPTYSTEADADADLSNLEDEQIFGVEETSGNTEGYQYPVNVVESGNMHSVTSSAVAGALSYSTNEIATGGKWIDGKPIYRKVIEVNGIIPSGGISTGCPAGSLIISLNALQVWNDTNWGNYYTTTNLQYTGSCNPAVLISSDGTTLIPSTSLTNKYTKCIIIEYVKLTN